MADPNKIIYMTCRESAGFTRERAAELLNVGTRTLARWELGESLPPDDIAYNMVMLYNSPYLAVQHLRLSSRVVDFILPAIDDCSLQTAAIRLINRVLLFADSHRDRQLLKIVEDGQITEDERPVLSDILIDLQEIVKTCTEVRLAAEKEDSHEQI